MRVVIVGGGPAGLCLALGLTTAGISHDVTVIERMQADEAQGWGITLPRRQVAKLELVDAALCERILDESASWDEVAVFHHGRRVEISGTRLIGISRRALLNILQQRCRDVGVRIQFGATVDGPDLPEADLLVAADGTRSELRKRFGAQFGTTSRILKNKFAWLGTTHVFPALSFAFEQNGDGCFLAHGYPYSRTESTFLVECSADTWQRAGFDRRTAEETCDYLATLFTKPLHFHPVLHRREVRWDSFVSLSNQHWFHDKLVLVGDAAHSVHFSVGSGTMLAFDDGVALTKHLRSHDVLQDALTHFEKDRQAAIEPYQEMESLMVHKIEHMDELMTLEPLEVAYRLLSR